LNSIYHLVAFFLFYSFLGWALEVSFHVVTLGKFINRGFLNGPICPIYGVGMVTVLSVLEPFTDNLWLLFLGGLIFATAIELIGGFVLFKLFHMRWWDYSKEPFNLGGYICIRFSLAWGVCIVFAIDVFHPLVEKLVNLGDGIVGYILASILSVVLILDIIVTVLAVTKLNKDLKYINTIAEDIHKVSDGLTDAIGNTTMKAANKIQEGQIQASLAKAELRDNIDDFKKHSRGLFGYGRLYKAFPNAIHADYNEEMQLLFNNLKGKYEKITDKIGDIEDNISGKIEDISGNISDKIEDIGENISGKIDSISSSVSDKINKKDE